MRFLYDIFFIVFGIVYLPYLLIKGKAHNQFIQRFGVLPREIKRINNPIWIHGVSVGEAALAADLSKKLKAMFPEEKIIVSTTTQTGNKIVSKHVGTSIDAVFYFPLDISGIVSHVVKVLDPKLYIMIETELWPNLIERLHIEKVPIVLVNGRISDNSFKNYKRFSFIIGRVLRFINTFCVQSEVDAKRLEEMGSSCDNITVTGNMKFDVNFYREEVKNTREELGFNLEDKILIAGSTHFPEESKIIDIFKELASKKNFLKLVLAPRHVERVEAIRIYLEKKELKYRLFSSIDKKEYSDIAGYDVLLVDTVGHLKDIYSIGDIVFVGGSLAKRGGQNPIEPALWGKPIIFGPDMSNFREIAQVFLDRQAAIRVKNDIELKDTIEELLNNASERNKMSEKAKEVIKHNIGATEKTIAECKKYISG